jgi:peptidoglycan/LPS O-acetylase OafA/YrhL
MERVWDTLGRLSYPLYLVHWPVLVVTEHLLGARLPFPALAAVGLTASCAAAWAVLRLYDEPVRSFRPAAAVA